MRECERYWIVLQEMNWEKLTGIPLFGDCSWLLQCMQRSFLGKSTPRICAPSEIQQRSQLYRIVRRDSKNDSRKKLEISGVTELRWWNSTWEKLALAEDEEVIKFMKAKVYVFSDSVLCVGTMREFPRIHCRTGTSSFVLQGHKSVQRIWMAGHMTLQVLHEIQKLMATLLSSDKEFLGRIIFVSMVNDIEWVGKFTNCEYVRQKVRHKSFVIPRALFRRKWYSTLKVKPGGQWDEVAELMLLNFHESHHPIFRATSSLEREQLKSKERRSIIHSLLRGEVYHRKRCSHFCFCQSAQHLRSSCRFM